MKRILSVLSIIALVNPLLAGLRPVVLDSTYEHTKWGIEPSDKIFEFAAFTTSFDTADDNDGDSDPDVWGIPEWVAFEIKGNKEDNPVNRPSDWITDDTLHELRIAPSDDTYAVSGTRDIKEVKGSYRFVRGHMCPKDTAERVSADAAYNTHVVMNAVPQLQWQNNGVWKSLEEKCIDWADEHDRVWVVCGPVFFGKNPAMWLGQEDEVRAAIPDALFKIVVRETETELPETIAFLIPNIVPKTESDFMDFVTSIDYIEELTGLDFVTILSADQQAEVEAVDDGIGW